VVTPDDGNLLVVDDELFLREAVATSLRFLGFEVTAAENGTDALRLARNRPFDLLILAALLTVGPADLAALVATAAFALALPPNAAGFFLLRLLEDIKNARLEDVAVQAFQEAGLSVNQVQPSDTSESIAKQRTKTVLIYSYSILSVSVLLTVIGVSAALWHMAWWISVAFVVVTLVSPGVVVGAMASWPSGVKPPPRA